MLTSGLLLNGRYQIVRMIGTGGMGAVYEALDLRLNTTVALKQTLLPAQEGASFEREAQILARLRHPALPVVSDYFTEQHGQFLVMQYISGIELAVLIQQHHASLPLPDVLRWADQLLDVLGYLHHQDPPVIHRDIKPHNLKLTAEGTIVLLDFGLAKQNRMTSMRTLGPASIFGYTPQYAPLEQIQGSSTDQRSDFYSFGATLYHLLTGNPPPDALKRAAALVARQSDPLNPMTIDEPWLWLVITHLMALNQADRPGSVEELRVMLQPPAVPIASQTSASITVGTLINHAADAIEPASLQLHSLDEAAMAIEYERQRLAESLQSQVINPLGLLLAQANIYEQTIQDNSTIRTAISVLSALARQSIQQARDLGENLRPSILIDLGIEAALDTIANQLRRSHGTRVRLVTERKHERMPRKLEMALFRVAQDTCERAVQYAHANTIEIQYTYTVDHVQLSIGDDGAHQANLSMLDAAIQRIQQLGGSAQHARSPFGGLLLTIVLPLHSLAGLTDRELEVLRLLMVGQSNKQIANALQITLRTVNFHLDNIYSKLGVRSRTEAVIYALRYL